MIGKAKAMLIDVHAHYDNPKYDPDREETIKSAKIKGGVDLIVNSGSNLESSKASLDLADRHDFIYATIGIHPHDAAMAPDGALDALADLLKHEKALAVGEIGLDFHYGFSDRDSQRLWFAKQMGLAADMRYPVVIHDRETRGECLEMAKRHEGAVKGVFHCYAGDLEMAHELAGLGYMMSFGGMVTFSGAKTPREVAKGLPLEYILLETDCPYLAPSPHRGKRNDSGHLPLIAAAIAELKNVDISKVMEKTGENAIRCFGILPNVSDV